MFWQYQNNSKAKIRELMSIKQFYLNASLTGTSQFNKICGLRVITYTSTWTTGLLYHGHCVSGMATILAVGTLGHPRNHRIQVPIARHLLKETSPTETLKRTKNVFTGLNPKFYCVHHPALLGAILLLPLRHLLWTGSSIHIWVGPWTWGSTAVHQHFFLKENKTI